MVLRAALFATRARRSHPGRHVPVSTFNFADAIGYLPVNGSHETCGCQFTNAPLGLSFHAQTCSV